MKSRFKPSKTMNASGRPVTVRTRDGRSAPHVASGNDISPATFRSRLARGWDVDQAATVPVRRASRDRVK